MGDNNWSVLTEEQINEILHRLDMLQDDISSQYTSHIRTAIDDIEDILRKRK